MSFSFDYTLPTPIDRVRQRLGDVENTDTVPCMVQDETILAYIASGLTELRVAARLARDIASRAARLVDSEGDRQNAKASQLYKQYSELADRLEAEANVAQGGPVAVNAITVYGTDRGCDDYAVPGIPSRPLWFGQPWDY